MGLYTMDKPKQVKKTDSRGASGRAPADAESSSVPQVGANGRLLESAKRNMYLALKKLGFLQFDAYLLKRTGASLASMARELDMELADFKAYHDAFLRENGIKPLMPL